MPQSPSINPLIPRFNQLKWKMAGAGVLVGLVSGLLVVLYRLGIEQATAAARWIYAQIRETPWLLAPWFVAAVAASALIAWMIAKEPMASGSGIPQTNGVVICGLRMRSGRRFCRSVSSVDFLVRCSACRWGARGRRFRSALRVHSFCRIVCVASVVRTFRSSIW